VSLARARIRSYFVPHRIATLQAGRPSTEAGFHCRSRVGSGLRSCFRCVLPGKVLIVFLFAGFFPVLLQAETRHADQSLELSRPVRSWEFASAVGTRAALLGKESGEFEAWAYPLKILRNFHLRFLVGGRTLPAETLARTVIAHPESTTIVYASDDFSVRETWFVPVNEPGAVITFDIETSQSLEIEDTFQRDLQLEWPAALGGTYISWDPDLHAFYLGEESKKYAAFVGSPSASEYREEFFSNYSSSSENSFRLGVTGKGSDRKMIVIAASIASRAHAQRTYLHLASDYKALYTESANYYRAYLTKTVQLELPDPQLQHAYDWSRISMVQGVVANPFLGAGLVAGYRTSGDGQRPGFAWFFGRDSLWTSLALDAEGDSDTTRTALEFLSKYQRQDGKIPHEISQATGLVDWFKDYPYGYASADATPLFIITMNDYVIRSGDVEFAKKNWDAVWKAYQFLRSTYSAEGLPQNFGIGHGWVEGGPLLPVKTELYQSGLGAEALLALANLAHLVGKEDAAQQLQQEFSHQQQLLNQAFWVADQKIFAFALDNNGKQVAIPSVLATVPMWFGLLDEEKAKAMLDRLADYDLQADWGMRIISSRDPKYNPAGYHFGAVWPLFTGWASVGEYRYHRALPGYSNLRANSLLALDGSLGNVTEVLSGDYYESLSTSSPHQIWSAAMVVNPILRGMLGLEVDAVAKHLRFAPHLPADWTFLRIDNLHVASSTLQLTYRKTETSITLQVTSSGPDKCQIEFAPALSLRATVSGAEISGRSLALRIIPNAIDQHAMVQFSSGTATQNVSLHLRNDFGVVVPSTLPPLGSPSQELRVLSESWSANRDSLTMGISGVSGAEYQLPLWNAAQVSSIDAGEIKTEQGRTFVHVRLPQAPEQYTHSQLIFHFAAGGGPVETRKVKH